MRSDAVQVLPAAASADGVLYVVSDVGPVLEASDHLLEPTYFLLLILVGLLLLEEVAHLLGPVGGVVAWILGRLSVFDFHDALDGTIEQGTVVGDEDDCAG